MSQAERVLITPPTADVLTRDEVKLHLRVDFDDDNDLIDGMILAAVGQLDPAAGGWLGRALRPQTWELQLRDFWQRDCGEPDLIVLPYPPLISIDSVTYVDGAGATQTLAAGTGYRVLGQGAICQGIGPPCGESWPSVRADAAAVKIRFTCGYPPANAQADPPVVDRLPAAIKAWLKLYVGALYQFRENVVAGPGGAPVELPAHILQMISPYRVYS